jgi:uncharacterized membrane protein
MTAFTVWKFDTPEGAEHAVTMLRNAEDEDLVKVLDHAVVSWPEGADKPKIHHAHDDTKRGAGWGAVWGLLLGAIFLMPVVGAVAGGAVGALTKASEKLGISKEQLEGIRDEVTPGTSALFAVTDEGNLDRLGERFRGMNMKLIQTNLTPAEQEELLETFGGR